MFKPRHRHVIKTFRIVNEHVEILKVPVNEEVRPNCDLGTLRYNLRLRVLLIRLFE